MPPVVPLTLDDSETLISLLALQRTAYAAEAELIGFDGIPARYETLEDLQRRPEQWLGVREYGSVIAALAYEETPAVLDISRLMVSPAMARRGLGTRLVNAVIDAVPRPLTIVSTPSANAPALALYRKAGFTPVGEEEVVPGLVVTHLQRPGPT